MLHETLVPEDTVPKATAADEPIGEATYSPEDDKLRLYPHERLADDIYRRVKEAGFNWAPRQELFYAKWSPTREDLLFELAGGIGDEDKSLVERAEERAERFEDYEGNRRLDGDAANAQADGLSQRFSFGQPILKGHHSEKGARRDKARMVDATRRALSNWEQADYWKRRADRAIGAAKYRQRPDVRARRIKKIEAEIRKYKRMFTPRNPHDQIMQRRWSCPVCREYSCEEHPEAQLKVPHVYCGAARGGSWTPVADLPAIEGSYSRWIAHGNMRLAYEKAMLENEGQGDLLKKKPRRKLPPLLNYRAETIHYDNPYHDETVAAPQVGMTKAQYRRIPSDNRGTRLVGGAHRVRTTTEFWANSVLGVSSNGYPLSTVAVFLTDSKVHTVPEAA